MPYILPPDEVPLYYEEAGQGRNVLLIHGGAASTKFWRKQIPELSRRFRVVAIDLRGHGNSGKTEEGNTIAQYGRDLRHILETLGLDRVVPVGWSVGTSVVWSYIRQFGVEHLAGFVIVDQRPHGWNTEEGLQGLIQGIRTRKFRTHWERLRSFLVTPPAEEDLYWMTCEMMKTPTNVYCALLQDSFQLDFRPLLPRVTIPTLICGSSRGFVQGDTGQYMVQAMPKARLVMFENCAHMLFWEQPEKFNQEVAAFVEEVTG